MTIALTQKLFNAILHNQEKEALDCLAQGAFVDRTVTSSNGTTGITSLSLAAARGLNSVVSVLIEKGHSVNPVDSKGFTPFLEAASNGHQAVLETLYTNGTNVLTQTLKTRSTALHLAAQEGHLDCVRLICRNTPQLITVLNEKGETPLNVAICAQKDHVTAFFLDECDVKDQLNQPTDAGDYSLHLLVTMQANEALLTKAINVGATLKMVDSHNRTPSQLADVFHYDSQCKLLRAREFPSFYLATTQQPVPQPDAAYPTGANSDLSQQIADLKL